MTEPTFGDKVVLAAISALISAVVGGVSGFLGGLAAEKPKRRAAQLDDIDTLVIELVADLDDANFRLGRGHAVSADEARAMMRRRHILGEKLNYAHKGVDAWRPIESALVRVDITIAAIEDASSAQPPTALTLNMNEVTSQLKSAVGGASGTSWVRGVWGRK